MDFSTGMLMGMTLSNSLNSIGRSGGPDGPVESIAIIVSAFYATQILVIWGAVLTIPENLFKYHWSGRRRLLHFIWWHIPFIPFFVAMIKKVLDR